MKGTFAAKIHPRSTRLSKIQIQAKNGRYVENRGKKIEFKVEMFAEGLKQPDVNHGKRGN